MPVQKFFRLLEPHAEAADELERARLPRVADRAATAPVFGPAIRITIGTGGPT